MDCRAALAMTEGRSQRRGLRLCAHGLRLCERSAAAHDFGLRLCAPGLRLCERSAAAYDFRLHGLPRFARNDARDMDCRAALAMTEGALAMTGGETLTWEAQF
jgi:hypothetical protein